MQRWHRYRQIELVLVAIAAGAGLGSFLLAAFTLLQ
jgi:hypothetical protein